MSLSIDDSSELVAVDEAAIVEVELLQLVQVLRDVFPCLASKVLLGIEVLSLGAGFFQELVVKGEELGAVLDDYSLLRIGCDGAADFVLGQGEGVAEIVAEAAGGGNASCTTAFTGTTVVVAQRAAAAGKVATGTTADPCLSRH